VSWAAQQFEEKLPQPPHSSRPTILTAVTDKEYTKLFATSPAKAKASATTNSFVQKLLTTPKFHAAAAA